MNFPEIDLRQRLTVSRGYGVAEIHIPERSEYIGKTIHESRLREKDIVVLTLHRNAKVIPNPKSERELFAGDRLLCFGKLELMRDMTPKKVRRKQQPKVKNLPELPVADEVYKESGTIDSVFIHTETDMIDHE